MTIRSNAEFESKLPRFKVTPSKDFKEFLLVECPREDCPSHGKDGNVRPFLVHKRTWTRPRKVNYNPGVVIYGRPCPYCSKVCSIRRLA